MQRVLIAASCRLEQIVVACLCDPERTPGFVRLRKKRLLMPDRNNGVLLPMNNQNGTVNIFLSPRPTLSVGLLRVNMAACQRTKSSCLRKIPTISGVNGLAKFLYGLAVDCGHLVALIPEENGPARLFIE